MGATTLNGGGMVQEQLFADVEVDVRVVWVSLIDRMARLAVGGAYYEVHEGQAAPARGRLGRALEAALRRALREAAASGVCFGQ